MTDNVRPPFDKEISAIAEYVENFKIESALAYETARYDLLDSVACALLALQNHDCKRLIGPVVQGAALSKGSRVIGTHYCLDPVQAAFCNGALIRWLDFNDTWLAAEWGHPSDNLGGILSICDYLDRNHRPITMRELFTAQIKAHEIQGIIALENSFNRVGLDHVILVKIATTAVITHLLGGNQNVLCNAISNGWIDGQALRTYRHAPNTGSRKSWAAGDATSRGVRLALMALQGEMGYPSALTAPKWGFYDVCFKGESFKFQRDYGQYVMENILFKISFPAEFHAQTAVECALQLHPLVGNRLDSIQKVIIKTQESAVRIINKTGPLYNPADRDHCIQYMTAVGLIFGELTEHHYQESIAQDPRIDALRAKMEVIEDPRFTREYLEPDKRSIGNAVQVFFIDGTHTPEISIDYPIGHPRRRQEGIPLLKEKFTKSVKSSFDDKQVDRIMNNSENLMTLDKLRVSEWLNLFIPENT